MLGGMERKKGKKRVRMGCVTREGGDEVEGARAGDGEEWKKSEVRMGGKEWGICASGMARMREKRQRRGGPVPSMGGRDGSSSRRKRVLLPPSFPLSLPSSRCREIDPTHANDHSSPTKAGAAVVVADAAAVVLGG